VGERTLEVKRREVGAQVDLKAIRQQLLGVGKSGSFLSDLVDRVQARRGALRVPLVVSLRRDVAVEFFTELKEAVDRPPIPTKLDLDERKVVPGIDGCLLDVYDSLAATELALRGGKRRVKLAVAIRSANSETKITKDLVISHVLGEFSTVYSLADKDRDRAFNLKVGASKIDGTILRPDEELSFNETLGPRTKKEGYRTAPVISEGELVDGMAGGACQLSSTLFAASFFAGLDLLSSRPHTRPSSYIKMGLDAAVAYPTTDLKLRNPYPFPVVIHYKVNRGKVRVRILGKKRPWRKIVFEREVTEEIPFKEILRKDPKIPQGKRQIGQLGVPGFKLKRRRLFYGDKGAPEKTEERELGYPPTTQYLQVGTGPADPDWKPKEVKPFGEVPPQFTLSQ
jgi:vancomycin resistance protein YoaR